jgi:O-acetylserine/cysteine efflux transporter
MKPADIALAVTVPVLWGVAFTLAKPAVAHFPPLLMMAMTYVVTGLCLFHRLPKLKTPFWTMVGLTLFVATIQAGLLLHGLLGLPVSTAVLLLQLQAPFAVLFAWPLAGERPTPLRLLGTALSFVGVVIVVGAPSDDIPWIPALMVTSSGASWALGQVAARRFARDDGVTLTVGIALYALPQVLLVSALVEHGQWTSIVTASLLDWATFAAFALFGFVLAYCIWYGLLRRYRVEQVTPFSLLMPAVGVLAGVLLLGEKISAGELAGGAVIMVGLAVVVFAKGSPPVAVERLS